MDVDLNDGIYYVLIEGYSSYSGIYNLEVTRSVYGCLDPTAYNYDPNVTIVNSTSEPIIYGCTDDVAYNYDEYAKTNYGSCVDRIYGCMDYLSCNYDTLYNVNDSSLCTYA